MLFGLCKEMIFMCDITDICDTDDEDNDTCGNYGESDFGTELPLLY